MKALLSKSRLNKITRALYGRRIEAVFYSVTPVDGETEIGRITSGFTPIRERLTANEGKSVKFLLSGSANINPSELDIGGQVELIIEGRSTKYRIEDLLPQQQLGAGYVLVLGPMKGATA